MTANPDLAAAIDAGAHMAGLGWTVEAVHPGDVWRTHGRSDAAADIDAVRPPQLTVVHL